MALPAYMSGVRDATTCRCDSPGFFIRAVQRWKTSTAFPCLHSGHATVSIPQRPDGQRERGAERCDSARRASLHAAPQRTLLAGRSGRRGAAASLSLSLVGGAPAGRRASLLLLDSDPQRLADKSDS